MKKVVALGMMAGAAMAAHAACGKKMEVPHQKQPTDYSCGPTSLAMAMNHYGHSYKGGDICAYLGNCYSSSGTDFEQMTRAASHWGFKNTAWKYGVTEMMNALAANVTTVAIINVKAGAYPMKTDGTAAFQSFTGGHYIEIHGVHCDSTGNPDYFYVNDPAQAGWKDRQYTYSSMKSAWGQRDYRFLAMKSY